MGMQPPLPVRPTLTARNRASRFSPRASSFTRAARWIRQGLLFALWISVAFAAGTASAQTTLTVRNGALGLETAPGATNHVWADPPSADAVFDRWTGDTTLLADPTAWHTTAVMPAAPATVTATYKPAPPWTAATSVLNGRPATDPAAVRLLYHFPANPVGVIFFFHGSGGSATGWFDNVENLTLLRDAVAAGYAVAALDSSDRTLRQWDSAITAGNVDVGNVRSAIAYFTGAGLLTADTPKFAVGMSNGGGFAPKPAYFLGFRGCAIWCASGQPAQVFNVTTVPTIWNLAQNDDRFDHTDFLADSQANLAALRAQQTPVAGELRETVPSPVYPRRFLRVPGLTAADSQFIYDRLNDGGFLDAAGYLRADPETSGWENVLPATYRPYLNAILAQLDCCYSGHRFFSDFSSRTLQFFGASHPPFFTGETPLSNGVYYLAFPGNGNIFGYYSYLSTPRFLYHFDLGYEYWFDAGNSEQGLFLYDFASGSFFYTSPAFPFPYLYDFSLGAILYYYPDPQNPGRYNTNGTRYFFNLTTGQIIVK